MTGTSLLSGVDIEVALGIGTIKPGAAWDAGTFDYNTWQETDTPLGDWTDVTCDVAEPVALASGSSPDGVVTRWEAQTCNLTLVGPTWDPRSGPYVGLLGPALPVRVRWRPTGTDDSAWLTTFVGAADDDGFTYDPKTELATVAATDGTRILAAFDGVEQPPIGAGESAAARVNRIADMAGWPVAQRDIAPGGVAVQATTLADAAWTMLLAVADTDLALLWINRAGQLAYRPEGKVIPSLKLAAVIGCVPDPGDGTIVVDPVNITGQQPTITRNIVSISRQAASDDDTAVTVTLRDDSSVARFLAHSYERTDLIHVNDAWSTTVAQAVLMGGAWPSTSPASVDLSSRADPAASALLLSLEPSLSIDVTDGINTWQCEPAGWQVTITRGEVAGTISLLDVSAWYGAGWDSTDTTDGWDESAWGF